MFRVDEPFRVEMPPLPEGPIQGAGYFWAAELTNNEPIWLLHVLQKAHDVEEEPPRWRRLLVHGVDAAVEVATLSTWASSFIYVLLPNYMTGRDRIQLAACNAIWECLEPDDDLPCWRIETDVGVILDSMYGTVLGQERTARLLWESEISS
jgi:hypothetical protein